MSDALESKSGILINLITRLFHGNSPARQHEPCAQQKGRPLYITVYSFWKHRQLCLWTGLCLSGKPHISQRSTTTCFKRHLWQRNFSIVMKNKPRGNLNIKKNIGRELTSWAIYKGEMRKELILKSILP